SEEKTQKKKEYRFPPVSLLKYGKSSNGRNNDEIVRENGIKLKETLESFGVNVTITDYSVGPSVTRYELQPEQGVKVSKIVGLQDDIKLALAAADIRIEAPIPGKPAVGIEIPNAEKKKVYFRELIESDKFKETNSNVAFAVGKDIGGQVIVTDIAKMPHLLIAGATGSGKSVCVNTIIMSILYKAKPDDVKLIMIDPKMVELTAYNGIPHLLIPVVTDPKKAAGALNWAVVEMTKRYQLFANYNVRNIKGFNQKVETEGPKEDDPMFRRLPQIVVIVDELADLMMVAHAEVEDAIIRLCQLARAAGIHLIIATQRPSVDVITGLIKANVPSRIAFAVSSGVDSRTILDMNGAEKLLGKGDMLFYPTGYPKPIRVQGALIEDEEVVSIVEFIKKYNDGSYDENVSQSIENSTSQGSGASASTDGGAEDDRFDEYFEDAARLVIEKDKASIGNLQRVFRIGFNRAARIMDQLCDAGVVGPEEGTKPRKILMTMDQFDEFMSL
ncbi:MAG TPA: DNA translocase FtsK, partial [Lachnospiraceae bacterium]|nr:DNA translocase FtsK [Lachnospiraceae bacterium]